MIGLIVGAVASLVIFTFFNRDDKAVRLYKQKKITQEKQLQQQKKKQLQEIEKLKNDPLIKQKRQEKQKQFQQKFMNKMDQKDKQLIKDYLQKNRKQGKTDDQIMKDASFQTTLFMGFMFIVIITLVAAALILNGVQLDQIKDTTIKFLGQIFPKIKETTSSISDDL